MRLTLRTLLAYLDDILPPAETKELGEKIAASPVASQLVDRIRDVMRRRRLTAPETDGSGGGIEPNLVAEYLDNSLPADRVADVERVCLESDVNLAEVAACHQILTLVLGEPVEIPNRLRERMYALGPQGTPLDVPDNGAPLKGRETTAREQLAAIQAAQKAKPASVAKPAGSRVPDYLRSKPLWKRVLPWMILPLLLLAYVALFWYDPTFFPGRGKAQNDGKVATADKETRAESAEPDRVPEQEPAAETETGATAAATTLPDLPVDPEPPADGPESAGTSPPMQAEPSPEPPLEATASTTDEGTIPAPADSATAETSEPPATASETTAAIDPAAPQLDVFSTDGVVLRFDSTSGEWFPLAAENDPPAGAAVAVPVPFRADLKVENVPLRLLAFGGTKLTPFGQTEAAPVGFDLAQGRLRITSDTAAATDATKMMFALRLGPELWRIEPLTPETVVGIEALPLQPSGEGQDLSGRTPQGVLYVSAGAARVADASGRVEVASAGHRLILAPSSGTSVMSPPEAAAISTEPAEESTEEAGPEPAGTDLAPEASESPETPETDADVDPAATPEAPAEGASPPTEEAPAAVELLAPFSMPDWVVAPREPTASARRMAAAFKGEFVPEAPASGSLIPAVKNRNFNIAEPAARALALIEDIDGLVRTLRDTEHAEATLAAIDGLRNWLGRSPDNGEILRENLDATFSREGMSEILYELLWGYDAEDARDTATAERLVGWLSYPEPVVRELAFYHIKRLSGRTFNYNPLATENQRAGAINLWRAFVTRHGGLVVGP